MSEQTNTNAPATQLSPSRLPLSPAIAREFSLTPQDWRVLVDAIYPNARSAESVLMALSYCKARNLDPFKRQAHIVPVWSSAKRGYVETIWPGIAELRTTASRTGQYAGIDPVEFGPLIEREFQGRVKDKKGEWFDKIAVIRYPEWASVKVYRIVEGRKCEFHAKIYWEETYGAQGGTELPNDMWAKRPRGQIDKCVEAAALRKAFPEELGGVYSADEMEGQNMHDDGPEIVPYAPPKPVRPPEPAQNRTSAPPKQDAPKPADKPKQESKPADKQKQPDKQKQESQPAEQVDVETGEVIEPDGNTLPPLAGDALAQFLTNVEETLVIAKTPAHIEEFWADMEVDEQLAHDPAALKDAQKIKADRLKAITPEKK